MNPAKYVIVAAAAFSLAAAAANGNPYCDFLPSKLRKTQHHVRMAALPAMAVGMNDSASWRPRTAVHTDWDGRKWVPYGKYTFSYDADLNVVEELSESLAPEGVYVKYAKRLYTYDALGRLTRSTLLAGETLDNLEQLQYADISYDDVLTDLVIRQDSYTLTDGGWALDDQSYRREITRDSDGNIVEMTARTYYEGEFIEVESLKTVFEDGVPVTMKERMLTQDEDTGELKMAETETYSDCKWYSTDGQITSLDDITVGRNHLQSANIKTPDVSDMKMEIVYKDGSDDYTATSTATLMYVVPTTTVFEFTRLPNGGSYQKTTQDMDIPQYGHAQKIMTLDNQFDEWGNLIISKQVTTYGATTVDKWLQGEFVRDEQHGYPLQYLQKEFTQYQGQTGGEWEDKYRIEYSDYVQPSVGVSETEADGNADAEAEYYTLDGRRCSDRPASGICLKVKKGVTPRKLLVK